MTKTQIAALEKKEAEIVTKSNRTDYTRGVIQGHYAGSKKATGYLKTHTRCTKGHGWTLKGEFGGCAICEKEED